MPFSSLTFYSALMSLLCAVFFAKGLKSGLSWNPTITLTTFLESHHARGSVTVSQEHYSMACLERFGLANCNGNDKPNSSRLTVKDQPTAVNTVGQELYRGMVGSLLFFASWTRPDISCAVSELSRFVSNPGKPHLEAAKRVFRYIKRLIVSVSYIGP